MFLQIVLFPRGTFAYNFVGKHGHPKTYNLCQLKIIFKLNFMKTIFRLFKLNNRTYVKKRGDGEEKKKKGNHFV